MTQKRKNRRDDGYSLLEILVVMAIISLLATLVAPRLFSQVDKSKITTAKSQAKSIRLALDAYRLDTGRYPTAEEGLTGLVQNVSNNPGWYGPYMDGELPLDPWGNSYQYVAPEIDNNNRQLSPKVVSYGADGAPGGSGNDADISS